MEVITLSNGKRVANFSSPHAFTFTDGTILPAVPDNKAEHLKVTFIEEELNDKGDIGLSFELSQDVLTEINIWLDIFNRGLVDVVFCPLPMIVAMKEQEFDILNTPFRAIRIEDRLKKLISITKQSL